MNKRLKRIALSITRYKYYLYLKADSKKVGGENNGRREKSDLE